MERVALVGCGGSGKTHLARRLARQLDLPLTHLDAVHYDEAWRPLPPAEFAARQAELAAAPRWIMEGNYAATLAVRLQRADTVIVLDLPARACLWGILQRRLRHGGGQDPAAGVYDRISWSFLRYVLGYRRNMLPRVQALIGEHAPEAEVVVLHSRRALSRFLLPHPR